MPMATIREQSATNSRRPPAAWLAILMLVPTVGCHAWKQDPPLGKSPLRPAVPSHDSVTLEIWTVRLPLGESQPSDTVWNEIDEQQIPTHVRRELKRNGLRVGVVSASVPNSLARMLELTDTPPEANAVWQEIDLQASPNITRRVVQLREGGTVEITPTSTVYDELHLLHHEDGTVRGRSYSDAQAVFNMQVTLNGDGSVRLQWTPELHYGPAQQKISSRGGDAARYETNRAKEVYEKLRASASISPGVMLLLGSEVDRSGSLGHYFFSEDSPDGPQQRLLLVRLARSPPGDLFADE